MAYGLIDIRSKPWVLLRQSSSQVFCTVGNTWVLSSSEENLILQKLMTGPVIIVQDTTFLENTLQWLPTVLLLHVSSMID